MKIVAAFLCICFTTFAIAQSEYEPTALDPYGMKNPKAPKQLDDFKPMIGMCDCDSERRNPDGTWAKAVKMTWKFKYIMNGMAIQDETLKADGKHSGSIRQFPWVHGKGRKQKMGRSSYTNHKKRRTVWMVFHA